MSVLNSHSRAGNSPSKPVPKSISSGSTTVAPRLSSVSTVSSKIATVAASRDRRVVRVPDADPGAVERVGVEELGVVAEGVAGLRGGGRVVRVDADRRPRGGRRRR